MKKLHSPKSLLAHLPNTANLNLNSIPFPERRGQ